MNSDEYLRKIPKVELHNHIVGAMRLETALDLAKKHDLNVPVEDPQKLYEYDTLVEFLVSHTFVCETVRDREDFARIAFECLEDAYVMGNVKYSEVFCNPTNHLANGIPYRTIMDGFVDGIRRAEAELGVRARLVPSINREEPVAVAQAMLDEMIAYRQDEVIGLGIDHHELPFPPEMFAGVYQQAGRAGFRRTAHTSHDAPASWITTCLDELGCERIDHGYRVTQDPEVLRRVVDEQVPFTCAPTTAGAFWQIPESDEPDAPLTNPIRLMVERGVNVTLGSDDPTMFHTDQGLEYVKFCNELGFEPKQAVDASLAAIEGSWLTDAEKADLRKSFKTEIDGLTAQLSA
ncbi:adenosine deaminase [Nocardioides sp. AN3]